MARYIDAETALKIIDSYAKTVSEDGKTVVEAIRDIVEIITPTADVAPRAEVIEEYRKKVYAKMEKYTVFGREYIQRIMREVEKEMKGGE